MGLFIALASVLGVAVLSMLVAMLWVLSTYVG